MKVFERLIDFCYIESQFTVSFQIERGVGKEETSKVKVRLKMVFLLCSIVWQ